MPAPNRGFALILVIWSLVIMLGLSAGFAMAVRHETRVAADAVHAAENEAATIAARHLALLALNHKDREQRWLPDGRSHQLRWGDAQLTIRVRSESGRIDLNRAPREVLLGLFEITLPEADQQTLVDSLIDWRDRDSDPLEHGAEDAAYTAAGLDYTPANQPFSSAHELSQVLGFDSTIIDAVRPYITVHSRRPRINAMSADAVVLAAIPGIDALAAELFVNQRDAALQDDDNPPLDLLRDGRRFVEMHLDNRNLLIDIVVRNPDRTAHSEQIVMALGRDRNYRLLARDLLFTAEAGTDLP